MRGNDGLFRLKDGSQADADPNVVAAGGYLEGSNVNVVEQMVSMISLARQFEMQTKIIQTAQSNDQSASQLLSDKGQEPATSQMCCTSHLDRSEAAERPHSH